MYSEDAKCLTETSSGLISIEPDLKENLLRKKKQYEFKLQEINNAIRALEENPGVEKILNLVSKTNRY